MFASQFQLDEIDVNRFLFYSLIIVIVSIVLYIIIEYLPFVNGRGAHLQGFKMFGSLAFVSGFFFSKKPIVLQDVRRLFDYLQMKLSISTNIAYVCLHRHNSATV